MNENSLESIYKFRHNWVKDLFCRSLKRSLGLHRTESYEDFAKKVKMAKVDHPLSELAGISRETGHDLDTLEFARHMDSIDPLRHLRQEFCYPKMGTLGAGRSVNLF